jgi:hypothetical protein
VYFARALLNNLFTGIEILPEGEYHTSNSYQGVLSTNY